MSAARKVTLQLPLADLLEKAQRSSGKNLTANIRDALLQLPARVPEARRPWQVSPIDLDTPFAKTDGDRTRLECVDRLPRGRHGTIPTSSPLFADHQQGIACLVVLTEMLSG
ncbi:MAG: hypothetical protein U0802_18575 [Candidatus Binatia bacterium]